MDWFNILEAILLVTLALEKVECGCPERTDPSVREFQVGALCYQYFEDVDTQVLAPSARQDCQNKGGNLLTIPDNTTQAALYMNLLHISDSHTVWLGLSKQGSEWRWDNGSPLTFSNWEEGDDCLQCACAKILLSSEGKWKKFNCDQTDWYTVHVCEYGRATAGSSRRLLCGTLLTFLTVLFLLMA